VEDRAKPVETCDRKDIPKPVRFYYNIEERWLKVTFISYERMAEFMRGIWLWVVEYQNLLVTLGFAFGQVLMLVILLVTAMRVRRMKKEMDKTCEQVKNYLDYVLENDEDETQESDTDATVRAKRDEEENRIISTVLQEIFP
jgi:uncharacterized membrane protein (DUF485 family)